MAGGTTTVLNGILEELDFESAEEIVILMENVPEVLSMEDAVELNNQMLAI